MDETAVISRYFSKLGSRRTARKKAASRENILKAIAARAAPTERLEEAYKAVKAGQLTTTKAAIEIGKCSYYTLRSYIKERDSNKS